jgi:hypothetical protein
VLSDIARLSACLAVVGMVAALGGCADTTASRVYGFQAFAASIGKDPLDGRRSSTMSPAQEDAVIAQAIFAHEARRP